ncbi:MAG TPA: FtsQ-type POTRA domain-containing protein [Candidatus Dormibacteraeota bacterium]|nr:FtsQ-type POTRA domain-containing protein [Candidatus Dormibacteraeota bacterium]
MSPADTARRRAHARELAARIVDAPRVPRQFSLAPESALRGSTRRRVSAPAPRVARHPAVVPRSRGGWAVTLILTELAALLALLVLPTFHAAGIDVHGARLLSHRAVLDAAGIGDTQSIFTVDGEVVRQRLERLPWVRRATVETELPSTVRISIVEWDPVLEVRRGGGDQLVAGGGATVDRAAVRGGALPAVPVLIDERPDTGSGPAPLDGTLVRLLPAVAAGLPAAVGCALADFRWQGDGRLVIDSACRWSALLGRAGTPAEISAIPAQIAALAALKGRLNFARPDFGYVDLEDPSAPAVGGRPGPAATVPPPSAVPPAKPAPAPTPAPSPRPTPTPRPAPTSPPAPTPKPAPTPYSFSVGPPRR